MKGSLEQRILTFAFLVITLTIAANTAIHIEGFRRDYRDGIVLRAHSLASSLKTSIENVLGLGIPLEEMEGLNARCQEIVATDPEISYVLIEDTIGRPLYASDPSFSFPSDFELASSLNASTAILDSPQWGRVYDVAIPVYAAGGNLAGRVRVGFLNEVLEQRTGKAFRRSMVVLGVAILSVFALVVVFVKRDLVGPITRLCGFAREIASGNFRAVMPSVSTTDFAQLKQALQEMASSLSSRDERIHDGYRELESINLELQQSYEHQERISSELGRSREMYRSLLEHASDAIVVSDADDRIVLLNRAAEDFFGLVRDKIIGTNLFQTLEKLQVVDLEEQYRLHQTVLQGRSVEGELRIVRPTDHRPMVGWVLASAIAGKDGSRMVQAVYRDVTREREVKENLEQSARELARLNQMKDSFLGVASHELKTPLTVIIGYAELILGEMKGQVDPSVLAMIQHIADAAERLSRIVRDMTDVSMLDSRRLPLRLREIDLNALITDAIQEIRLFATLRRQSLEVRAGAGVPAILCDPDRMVQALSNLVGNAIKFTPDGGTIVVETRLVQSLRLPRPLPGEGTETIKALGARPVPYVEILVRDTGIGIAEEDQLHVFEKFYEVGNIEEHFTAQTAFKGKGTGLGLAIVKGVVDMHGGEVWVESAGCDPERCPGSTFHVMLPVVNETDSRKVSPS